MSKKLEKIIDILIEDLQENAMPFKNYVYEPKATHQIIRNHLIKINIMKNPFKKYKLYKTKKGKIIDVNPKALEQCTEALEKLIELYNIDYGSIEIKNNLVSIHTGGWSDNEYLISQFKDTAFWFKYHKITAKGGHYYFNTDTNGSSEWVISIKNN